MVSPAFMRSYDMGVYNGRAFLILGCLTALGLAACSGGGAVPSGAGGGSTLSAAKSLKCFTNDGGTCLIDKDGTVSLALPTPPPADAVAGVYFASDHSLNGTTLANLQAFKFTLNGPYQAGSPRASIPVTYNGVATHVWVYPQNCSFSSDFIHDSTVDPIDYPSSGNYCLELQSAGGAYYSSWSTFVSDFGSAVISGPPDFLADADNANGGNWTLTDIVVK